MKATEKGDKLPRHLWDSDIYYLELERVILKRIRGDKMGKLSKNTCCPYLCLSDCSKGVKKLICKDIHLALTNEKEL